MVIDAVCWLIFAAAATLMVCGCIFTRSEQRLPAPVLEKADKVPDQAECNLAPPAPAGPAKVGYA